MSEKLNCHPEFISGSLILPKDFLLLDPETCLAGRQASSG
jgi:hypothetical protein